MYASIKSSYITIEIFTYLDPKRKLKMIRYNKTLQALLSIDIMKYKILSGRYIIYDTNEKLKGKEYNLYNERNIMIYEGEYLNGKRNGKGKEYNDERGHIIFEGEYLNGKRNGKGKEYFYYWYRCSLIKKLLFEGKYLSDKKWDGKIYDYKVEKEYELKDGKGYIKENISETKLIFEGEYLEGERNGKGKEYNFNGDVLYEGGYLNGKKHGKGKEYYCNHQMKFEGDYLNGKKWNGKGYDINNNKIYEIKNGKGYLQEYDNDDNLIFEGEYFNGTRNGKGKEYGIDFIKFDKIFILIFEGDYINGEKYGKGKE